jgi:hypothetical protein
MRLAALTLLLAAPALVAAPVEKKPAKEPEPREIKLKGVKLPVRTEPLDKPVKVTDKEELAKAVPDKDAQAAIAKQVDFKKEYVLLFAWSGSSGDRLTMSAEKGEVTFTFKHGLVSDFRPHAQLYALPAKMTYRMAK